VKLLSVDIGERSFSVEPGNLYPSIVVHLSNVSVKAHATGGLRLATFELFNFTEFDIFGLDA